MLNLLKARLRHGKQYIPDLRKAALGSPFRGFPQINAKACGDVCKACVEHCPAGAISMEPLKIDMGKCIFCGDCARVCASGAVKFTNYYKLSSDKREYLVVDGSLSAEEYEKNAVRRSEEIKSLFGRSLKLRQVSAGGCNACEMELNAATNVNFDVGRYGIEFVASPRHADGVVITGPITSNVAYALENTYQAIPEPKIVILAGTCAISGGLFAASKAINREFLQKHKVDLYIPGCPIHPLTFATGIMDFLGIS